MRNEEEEMGERVEGTRGDCAAMSRSRDPPRCSAGGIAPACGGAAPKRRSISCLLCLGAVSFVPRLPHGARSYCMRLAGDGREEQLIIWVMTPDA